MKFKAFLFVICLIGLLLFQYKLVMPTIYKIVSSDLFFEDSGDDMKRTSQSTFLTENAFTQCNTYVASEYLADYSINLPKEAINAFSLGNFQYVINADIEISPANAASFSKRYACRIKYLNGSDTTGISDPENWSVNGISGLDNIEP